MVAVPGAGQGTSNSSPPLKTVAVHDEQWPVAFGKMIAVFV
jgi:hypothetical protein